MDVSRRDVLAGSVFAFGASAMLGSGTARANASDEATVIERVDILRKATQEADKAKLEQVTSGQLSYGHSGGRVETKEQFINAVVTRKAVVKSLAFPELKVAVAGNAAIARHIWLSESELDGKTTTTRIGVLQVWQKQDGDWKLLARQGFSLPA
jgi:ketosteroid isomerase-like protein